ncbi:iron complex transport system substrate-binding protein [Dehalogenimonas formicexedens]|uniref:Iron complex transport system substrate-binding protein n=2 Tax=Dehalogenimonas formicexedens TaxID=1839801 RepID=A0A1P8F7C2_9CHLR|nr:cobalamin-binding protein [Dehalogenimonas formicexedens]APV44245.1 iron complex transport system substrate-binding protein [Dehalogenimonas formicexedens]APV44272.1 iron complex transport system substrate-binding protein [Dehalogenimonas formicexedens]
MISFNKIINYTRAKIGFLSIALTAVLMIGLLPGCGSTTENTTSPVTTTPPPTTDYTVTFPLTIKDQTGQSFTFTKPATKIVSLAPGNTEIAFSIGLDANIIGDTTYCDYPPAAASKPKMGGFSTADTEAIVAAQPDLILTANLHITKVVPQLQSLLPKTAVFTLNPKTIQDVMDAMILVGKITDHLKQATEQVAALQAKFDSVTSKTVPLTSFQKPKVLYVLYPDPLMTVGPDTPQYQLVELAGGLSISRGMANGYPTMSIEALVAANPDIIITSGMGTAGSAKDQILNNPQLQTVAAVKNKQVFDIDGNIIQRMGPRLADGLIAMAQVIHPELGIK